MVNRQSHAVAKRIAKLNERIERLETALIESTEWIAILAGDSSWRLEDLKNIVKEIEKERKNGSAD